MQVKVRVFGDIVSDIGGSHDLTLGWDERGVPTRETLERLGLGDVEPSMKGLRK